MSSKELFRNNFVDSTEQIEPSETKITGTVPEWLRGDLLRACPAKFQLTEDFTMNHWYDGMALIYKFNFKGQKVTYSKRFLETDAYKKAMTFGRPIYTEFGTKSYPDPSKGFFSRILSNFDATSVTDNSAVNIFEMGNELFASSDTCYFRRFDRHTLETKEKVDLYKMCGVNFACCHVEHDGKGKYFNVGTSIMGTPKYHVIETSPTQDQKGNDVWQNTRILATTPARWKASSSYLHSFAMTENHLIILEHPYIASSLKLATAQIKGRCFRECMDWTPEEGARITIVKKSTGETRAHYFLDEPVWNVHFTNAFEIDNQIIIDVLAAKDDKGHDYHFLDKLRNNAVEPYIQNVKRYVFPFIDRIQDIPMQEELVKIPNCKASCMRTSSSQKGDHISVTGVRMADINLDYTCINKKYKGKPYKFVYGNGGFLADEATRNAIVKLNVQSGEHLLWRESEYQYPSEPTFVPAPKASEEDDGVVLFSLADTRPDMPHYLVILDAGTLNELARVETLVPIPAGHHGIFLFE